MELHGLKLNLILFAMPRQHHFLPYQYLVKISTGINLMACFDLLDTHIHVCLQLINFISLTGSHTCNRGYFICHIVEFCTVMTVVCCTGLVQDTSCLSPLCPISSWIMGGTSDKWRLLETTQVVHPWRETFAEG